MKHELIASVTAACALAMTGCATHPDKIVTASVSPLQYQNYDCAQLGAELERVADRANELYASLKRDADNDTAQMTVGMLLLWPTLFFLEGGDGPEAAEYAKLKGQREALEKVGIQQKCQLPTTASPTQENVTGAQQSGAPQ